MRRLRRRIAFLRWMRLNSLLETNHLLRRTVLNTPLRETFFRKRFIICFCDSLGRSSTRTAKTSHILSFRPSCRKGELFFPHPLMIFGLKFGYFASLQNRTEHSALAYLPTSIPLKSYNTIDKQMKKLQNAYIDPSNQAC